MAAKRQKAKEQESPDAELELLLDHLRRNRGFDFTGYKRASLERRIQKRMDDIRIASYAGYVDYLEVHPEEFNTLFNTILINVTSFFRDETAWTYLAEQVLPDLVARRAPTSGIRVWSAGCASGEEAYTIAILFAELLGPDAFRDRVKIYGTDIDEEALAKARHATYSETEISGVPEALREKYFDKSEAGYTFRKDFRRQVIFGRHDLIQDAPISKVDILICRNALMYFNAETQSRILARFHFALNDGGILFLGRAETMLTRASTFTPIDLARRISTKVPRGALDLRDRLLLLSQNGGEENAAAHTVTQARLREIATDVTPLAEITVDLQGVLIAANERARTLFSLGRDDVGRPIQDLKISYRPADLRSLIDRAYADRRPFLVRDVEWPHAPGDTRWLELQVIPIMDGATLLGASVSFIDVSGAKRLQEDLESAHQELRGAYEELQSTNEELETTNEELQSTIEELETTNEELQSTNEELETMNEELQSTNEELSTINDEVRIRSDEVAVLNAFLESILSGLRGAVIVVDPALQVTAWNPGAQELWGIRQEEAVGTNLLSLDIGIPVDKLKQPVKSCLSGAKVTVDLDLNGTNRRGRPIVCQVAISSLRGPADEIRGAILVMTQQTVTS